MSEKTKPQSRGEARRQAILDAAADLFLEQGVENTTLSHIVARSKGSRSTLYQQFGSKEGLLRAMVQEATTDIWGVITENPDADLSTEAGLFDLGCRFVSAALEPRALAVYRILACESRRLPELADVFYEFGPHTCEQLLADRFRQVFPPERAGASAEQLAQIFLGSVMGIYHVERVLEIEPTPRETVLDHIRVAVRFFLKAVNSPH